MAMILFFTDHNKDITNALNNYLLENSMEDQMNKDISRTIKDYKRFEWGLKEFYPQAIYVKMHKPLTEEKVYYIKYKLNTPRDGVKGYVENFRDR